MKKSKKIAMIIAVTLILVMAVGGTLAYLTSTAQVTNTFTVGDVEITLDETNVDEKGVPIVNEDGTAADRVVTNEYHLIPGQEYVKDPMVTVQNGSDESYVRMIMAVQNASAVQAIIDNPVHNLTDYAGLFADWDPAVWVYEGFVADEEANTISFEFRYFEKVAGNAAGEEALQLSPLFKKLVVPPYVTDEELAALYTGDDATTFKMIITAHAIQAAGFDDADAAWEAFNGQIEAEEAAKVNNEN